jgi:excisionase family DNA binding protein
MSAVVADLNDQEKKRVREPTRASHPAPADTLPLSVPPREAARLLSVSVEQIYKYLRTGVIASYREGKLRRVPTAAITKHIAARLADSSTEGWQPSTQVPPLRRRGSTAA